MGTQWLNIYSGYSSIAKHLNSLVEACLLCCKFCVFYMIAKCITLHLIFQLFILKLDPAFLPNN